MDTAGLADQVCGNGAVENAQHLAHDGGLAGKQKAQLKGYTEHPLTHWFMWQDIVHQQGCAVGHSSRPAAGAKAAPFATERHQLLIMASFTPDSEKAMLQPAALQVFLKFLCDVGR